MRDDIEGWGKAILAGFEHQESVIAQVIVNIAHHDVEHHSPVQFMRIRTRIRPVWPQYFGDSRV
jgi:hypothetical protein